MFMDFPMFPSKTSIETTLSTAMFGASGARLSAWLQLCVSGLSSSQCYADEGRVSSVYHLWLQPVGYREIPGYHVIYTLYTLYNIIPSASPVAGHLCRGKGYIEIHWIYDMNKTHEACVCGVGVWILSDNDGITLLMTFLEKSAMYLCHYMPWHMWCHDCAQCLAVSLEVKSGVSGHRSRASSARVWNQPALVGMSTHHSHLTRRPFGRRRSVCSDL